MTNKIYVTVKVPMIDQEYDIYIPIFKTIGNTIDLLVKTINELTEGHFPIKDNNILISSNGTIFNINSTLKECGIKNADKIILI